MTDKVDLIVVGVEGDISRADMSSKLVKAFKQEAFTFESLLDGAYGESAPYAAQTGVEKSLADGGKEQLEKLGLICTVLPTGESLKAIVRTPVARAPEPEPVPEPEQLQVEQAQQSTGLDTDEADIALASFKSDDRDKAEEVSSKEEVSFDIDEELDSGSSALASFKKDAKKKGSGGDAVDFSDDLELVGADGPSVGLADAKQAKHNIAEIDDSINHDFSDQIEDVGADKIASGLKDAQNVKPDFAADVKEVDFSDDVNLIGIREKDKTTPEVSKSKLEEETAERNLASFPKEDADDDSIDFSDELEILSSDAVPVATSPEGVIIKADVPEALAGGDAVDDLEADLIDPAPIEKEDKGPAEVDDGGLSLSTDNDAPLTAAKEKSNEAAADDGGLSLSEDDSAPLTAPKKKADPEAADDGGLNLSADESIEELQSVPDISTDDAITASADFASELSDVESAKDELSAPAAEGPTAPEVEEPVVAAEPEVQSAPEAQPVAAVGPAPAIQPDTAAEQTVSEPSTAAEVAQNGSEEAATPATSKVEIEDNNAQVEAAAASGGLVLPGQLSRSSVVPTVVSEDDLDNASATASLLQSMPAQGIAGADSDEDNLDVSEVVGDAIDKAQKDPSKNKSKKKLVAAVAGVAVLACAGSFAFMSAGSIAPLAANLRASASDITAVKDSARVVEKMRVDVAELKPGADLENLSTGQLLVNLSNNQRNGIVDLEPYFLESGDQVKRGPRIGAAIPAESELMIRNRQSHPADAYFDNWSNRDADLSLFLALLDNLIEKGDLEVAQQLSDRAKDKLFAVMSTQRLARAYSDVGEKTKVTRLMTLASRDTYLIKAPEERVLALSDYAFTEQAIGLNEGAMDTFLKTSILARSLVKPERRAVGLSSAAMYFHSSGRTDQAQELLEQALQAGNELPKNTASRDLAIRYIALSEGRMGLFNQALEHTKLIVDSIATVSAYHGIALAIESAGDDTNARKVLNMAYRAGSQIEDPDERSNLLSKVVLASETE